LKRIIEFKTNKCAPLIRSSKIYLSQKRGKKRFELEFLSFIISSLWTLLNKSITSLTKMIGTATKNTVGLWTKKLVVTALKGSFMIWVKAKPETLASNKRRKKKKIRIQMKKKQTKTQRNWQKSLQKKLMKN
jgi:hypothetical protein